MKRCKKCGLWLDDNATFCNTCGQMVIDEDAENTQSTSATNEKNTFYKRWWFWLIIVILGLAVIGGVTNSTNSDSPNNSTETLNLQESTADKSETEEPTTEEVTTEEPTTEEPTTAKPTESPAEYKDSCESIDFKTLSRNPEKYKGKKYKITGKVIQTLESSWSNTVELRINMTKETYEYIDDVTWSDTIYATVEVPEESDRILEDDIITIWGECDGLYSYESVLGSKVSLPKIDVKYYSIDN